MNLETSHGTATRVQLYTAFGVTRQAVHKALRAASEPTKERTPRPPRGTPVEVLKPAIEAKVREHPAWGVRKVWATLRRDGHVASCKRVYALMKAMGLTLPAHPMRGQTPRGHVTVPGSNRRWGSDITTVWTRRDGWVAVAPVLDYGDRFLLDFEVTKSQDALAVLAPLQRALESQFGHRRNVPDGLELRTDHGPQYTGADCEKLCWRWQLDHTFAPIGRPTGNAVVERFILTLKTELIWTRDWESRDELEAGLRAWTHVYNYERPHQALGWLTPAEKRDQHTLLARTRAA